MTQETGRILEGISVVDLTTYVTGGFATMMLANQGADVVKIERPNVGDDSRHSGPPFVAVDDHEGPGTAAAEAGESPYFWTVNYGKRSVELNLKADDGKQALYDLVKKADVFVENYRPGTADRLDVDYDTLRQHNDSLVYCSISAFGETGPWSDRPGYDLLVQGMSGLMSVTGNPDKPPAKVGVPETDLITAMWAGFGIVNALYRREQTGDGERVELGMLDATLPWMTKQAGKAFVGETPKRMGSQDPVIAPYQTIATADGYLNVGCGNQRLWEGLCEAIDREDLKTDDRFATNGDRVEHMDELETELTAALETRTTDEWMSLLVGEHGLPVGPVFDVSEALDNEQVEARGTVDEVEHAALGSVPALEHPLNYEHADAGFDTGPPMLGEDSRDVLEELGYAGDTIDKLIADGIVPDRSADDSE